MKFITYLPNLSRYLCFLLCFFFPPFSSLKAHQRGSTYRFRFPSALKFVLTLILDMLSCFDFITNGFKKRNGKGLSSHYGSDAARNEEDRAEREGGSAERVRPDENTTSGNDLSDDRGYGMHVFVDQPAEEPGIVDLVALHGLNGHYDRTWTATPKDEKAVNWLRDLLPEFVPHARIMSFGYNSTVRFSKSTSGIIDFAEELLAALMAWRLSGEEKKTTCHFRLPRPRGYHFQTGKAFTGFLISI